MDRCLQGSLLLETRDRALRFLPARIRVVVDKYLAGRSSVGHNGAILVLFMRREPTRNHGGNRAQAQRVCRRNLADHSATLLRATTTTSCAFVAHGSWRGDGSWLAHAWAVIRPLIVAPRRARPLLRTLSGLRSWSERPPSSFAMMAPPGSALALPSEDQALGAELSFKECDVRVANEARPPVGSPLSRVRTYGNL